MPAYRGSYASKADTHRVGERASAAAVWQLLSFLELPANARASLLAADDRNRQRRTIEHLYTADRVIAAYQHAGRTPAPVALDVQHAGQLDAAVLLVTTAVRNAHSFFDASGASPNGVRPVLLHYGCLNLAEALIAATFSTHPALTGRSGHGLSVANGTQIITAYPHGGFPAFHDSLCSRIDFYGQGRDYDLDVLLAIIPEVRDARDRVRGNRVGMNPKAVVANVEANIHDVGGSEAWTHILGLELMAVFALSCWSRYDPTEWERKLRGETSGDAYVYIALMDYLTHDFPLRIFNLLTGENHFFGPAKMSDNDFRRRLGTELARSRV
jgi:YaaC-like Protein